MWELYAMWSWFLVFFSESLRTRGSEPGSVRSTPETLKVAGGLG